MKYSTIIFLLTFCVPGFSDATPIKLLSCEARRAVLSRFEHDEDTGETKTVRVLFDIDNKLGLHDIIVLGSSSDLLDTLIKTALLRVSLKSFDANPHSVSLPIRFKQLGTSQEDRLRVYDCADLHLSPEEEIVVRNDFKVRVTPAFNEQMDAMATLQAIIDWDRSELTSGYMFYDFTVLRHRFFTDMLAEEIERRAASDQSRRSSLLDYLGVDSTKPIIVQKLVEEGRSQQICKVKVSKKSNNTVGNLEVSMQRVDGVWKVGSMSFDHNSISADSGISAPSSSLGRK